MFTIPLSIRIEATLKKELAIQKSLEEADRGEFISHENMRAWFASLGDNNKLRFPEPDVFVDKGKSNTNKVSFSTP